LRAFDDYIGLSYFQNVKSYFDRMTQRNSYYIHPANEYYQLGNIIIKTDSCGLRTGTKNYLPDKKTLMLLGDSVVFGWGVDYDSTFSGRLGKYFNVINAGVGSWNTQSEYNWFQSKGIYLNPDIVLLIMVSNDLKPSYLKSTSLLQTIVVKSYVLSCLKYFHKCLTYNESIENVSISIQALKNLEILCYQNNIDLRVCLYSPIKIKQKVLELLKAYCDDAKIPCVTMPNKCFEHRNTFIDGHLNSKGHEILTDYLIKYLR